VLAQHVLVVGGLGSEHLQHARVLQVDERVAGHGHGATRLVVAVDGGRTQQARHQRAHVLARTQRVTLLEQQQALLGRRLVPEIGLGPAIQGRWEEGRVEG
jgi:hypothetical protein